MRYILQYIMRYTGVRWSLILCDCCPFKENALGRDTCTLENAKLGVMLPTSHEPTRSGERGLERILP